MPPPRLHPPARPARRAAAQAIVKALLARGGTLVPVSLTGPGRGGTTVTVGEGEAVEVRMVGTDEDRRGALEEAMEKYPGMVVIDFTLPAAVNENAELYCAAGCPFVMGTTGGDRAKLMDDVASAGLYAVIAPQMGKQIVALQAGLETMAESFPAAFGGYTMTVVESHQSTKVDTSGTAKELVKSFNGMLGGEGFSNDDIEMVRDEEGQLGRMGVPKEALSGHAYHTYELTSADGSVTFQFQHNVCGRSIYAEGSVDAAVFLAVRIAAGAGDKKVFNMVDVLKSGAMA